MSRIGGYSPDTAKLILATVNYLRQSGFVIAQPGQDPGRIHQQSPIYVRNDSGVAIPPFACMQVTGAVDSGGQNYITVNKPADVTGAAGWFLFNGIAEIEIGGYGIGHDGPLVRMLTNGTTISCGDGWRPTIGQWYVSPGGTIFSAVGEDDIETNVMRALITGIAGCSNPVIRVYLDGLSLKEELCDGTINTIFTGTSC